MFLDNKSRPTITLWIIAIVVVHVILNVLPLWLSPDSFRGSALDNAETVLHLYTDDDSWGPMKEAVDYFYSTPAPNTARVYQHVFFENSVKFQYPPTALLISGAARWLHLDGDRSAFAYIGFGFIILTAIGTFLIVELRLGHDASPAERGALARSLRLASILLLVLTFRPIAGAFVIGQIQVWLSSLFAVALLLWLIGRYRSVGVVIGLMCCVKPQYAFILLWALAAGRWSMAVAGFATAGILLTVSVFIFGLQNHLDYIDVMAAISRTGEAFHENQSVNGLLNRILSVGNPVDFNNLYWRGDHFPPFTPLVYGGTLVTSALLLTASLANGFLSRRGDQARSFCVAGLSCTMASPVAWSHHYGMLFAVYFLLLADLRRLWPWALSIAGLYLVVANRILVVDLTAGSYWNFLQSPVLFAGLATLAMLYFAPAQDPALCSPTLLARTKTPRGERLE